MTVLVFSDTHGRRDRVEELLSHHRRADAVLFLGDGIRDLPYETCTEGGRLFAGVRGNCDGFFLSVRTEEMSPLSAPVPPHFLLFFLQTPGDWDKIGNV